MTEETRNHRIVRQCEESGEPYIVFRAKDSLVLPVLRQYKHDASDICKEVFVKEVEDRIDEFISWRLNNPSLLKFPD